MKAPSLALALLAEEEEDVEPEGLEVAAAPDVELEDGIPGIIGSNSP
jgi:hypothetical protein